MATAAVDERADAPATAWAGRDELALRPGPAAPEPVVQPKPWDGMRAAFRPEAAPKSLDAIYAFVVRDDTTQEERFAFSVHVKDQQATFREGPPPEGTQLTYRMTQGTFEGLRDRTVNGTAAFLSGKVAIDQVPRAKVLFNKGKLERFAAMFPS